ncbi:hypothetical protein [Aestuariibius sp. HNIBRBA575]|uniref:hypothetical protein n=1 Tax=Aestuariibius sp. HNIBRBA575 TaxID=3233343 RepID=UPI0034A531FB
MNAIITKSATILSNMALFAIGAVMALLGLSVIGVLALFALFMVGLTFLAAPFAQMIQPAASKDEAAPSVA